MIDIYRMGRWGRTTRTWVRKSCALLLRAEREAATPDERAVLAYEAHELLWAILFEVDVLVRMIPEYEIQDCEAHARTLYHALRDRRRALAMSNTAGRTPQEAAAFRAKAEKLGAPS